MKRLLIVSMLLAACSDRTTDPTSVAAAKIIAVTSPTVFGIRGAVAAPSPRIRVVDATGNGMPLQRIRFAVRSGGGSIARADTITDANGEASADWILGAYDNVLAVSLQPGAGKLFFVGYAATSLIADRLFQRVAFTGDEVAAPAVSLVDPRGNPVDGVKVRFTVTHGDGTLDDRRELDVDPAHGYAVASGWKLGQQPGRHTVQASVPGLASVEWEAIAIDSAAARWFAAEIPNATLGVITRRLAIHGGYFIEDVYYGGSHAGRRSGTLHGNASFEAHGCSWWEEENYAHCDTQPGSFESDGVVIGKIRYVELPGRRVGFPAAPLAARVFERLDAPFISAHGGVLLSRYVLHADGKFSLQYASPAWGFFEYEGTYTDNDGELVFKFAANHGQWQAKGWLNGNFLNVKYNTDMMLSDFEDATFRRRE